MKIWLDDIRTPPDDTWTWVKNVYEAIGLIMSFNIEKISFDHDLGIYSVGTFEKNNGYEVAKAIEILSSIGAINPFSWSIHSANPVGRHNIEMAMKNADKYWDKIDS